MMTFSDADIRAAGQLVMLDAAQEDIAYASDDSDVVADCFICPGCGENRVDWLVWTMETGALIVECQACKAHYDPAEV